MLMCIADWYAVRETKIIGQSAADVSFGASMLFAQCAKPWGW